MDHNFPEALDAAIEDGSFIRRSCYAKQQDKYIFAQGEKLLFINLEHYKVTDEDIFAEDWQIFGKGVLGMGNNNNPVIDPRCQKKFDKNHNTAKEKK